MSPDGSVADLMRRLQAGENEAADRIFRQYAHRLVGLARTRLNGLLRRKVDPEDVMQSALGSFFRATREGAYELADWDSLWGLLALITVRKCNRQVRLFRGEGRDVGREVNAPPATASRPAWEPASSEPTPAEAAIMAETVKCVLDERDRQILALTLQGGEPDQVAVQVGCTQRTVYRVLGYIKERLHQMGEEPGEGA
jgi:DNA-directed RNA polymerase specialized sigma24 family protein